MEKEEMTDVKFLVNIRKASGGRPDLANWPNHGAEIDRACAACDSKFGAWIGSEIRSLVEDSKLKMDPNAPVCFDIPGNPGGHKRRREAADLGQDAPMLCFGACRTASRFRREGAWNHASSAASYNSNVRSFCLPCPTKRGIRQG